MHTHLMVGSEPSLARSADGTPIAYWPSGSGSPLVMVHGAPAGRYGWAGLLPYLEPSVTACPIDRRGHGASGDAPAYAHAREFEDVAAVVEDIGGSVDLFGHSFGGPVALEGALLAPGVRRLILYEPWLCEFSPLPEGMLDRFEAMAEAGDHEGIMVLFLQDFAGFTDEQVEGIRAQPSWPARIEAAGLYGGREARVENDYRFDPERMSKMDRPVLLLLGSESPSDVRAAVDSVDATLPDSRIAILEGQGHFAHLMEPQLLAREIVGFITG
jgi:pimeloyl-ACP methyl ester carboxylesterase